MISIAVLIYLALVALFIFFLWRWTQYKQGGYVQKNQDKYPHGVGYGLDPFPGQPGPEVFEPRPLQLTPFMRLVSHNRFMPRDHDLERSVAMADQILNDQAKVHEEPGVEVKAPAPGEPGYVAPEAIVEVTVDKFTIHMQRGSPTSMSEGILSGVETSTYSIPNEWAEVITALAFEVKRLREGWTVTE